MTDDILTASIEIVGHVLSALPESVITGPRGNRRIVFAHELIDLEENAYLDLRYEVGAAFETSGSGSKLTIADFSIETRGKRKGACLRLWLAAARKSTGIDGVPA